MLQQLYPAVRAPDWSTLALPMTSCGVSEERGRWQVALEQRREGRLTCRTELELFGDGIVVVRHRLDALVEAEVARWGLNVCLNAQAWAGSSVRVRGREHLLPFDVGRQRIVSGALQPLVPAAALLTVQHPSGGLLALHSAGRELELEDQRNWTDPTYKIYSGPLSEASPFVLAAGSVQQQELTITWRTASVPVPPPEPPAVPVTPVRELPRVGIQLNSSASTGSELAPTVADLGVDHVRLDLERPGAAAVLSALPDVDVELAVLSSMQDPDVDPAELPEIVALVRAAPGRVVVLWHLDGRRTSLAADRAVDAVESSLPGVRVVPGTDAYFADLNRDRPVAGPAVSFSANPSVHTLDSANAFASLATQAELVRQAGELFGSQVYLTPVTFAPRAAPGAEHDAGHRGRVTPSDPRPTTLEGAAWTLGSVHALLSAEAASGTWHELFGATGLVDEDDGRSVVRPAFHALAALAAKERPRSRAVNDPGASWVGIHLVERQQLVVASLRPGRQTADLESLPGRPVRRRRLREQDLPAAGRTRRWWSTAPCSDLGTALVDLEAFEICVIDLARREPVRPDGDEPSANR